ncbi:3'-5' exonuclease [Streptomyces albiaxialis]|uniref:3'-5' exonuclease n=1 Tax=Streptomyces albiaxialis TaxID=329523 RepID=A0ABN2X0I1_9ACTN
MTFWYEAPLAAFALRATRTPLSRLPSDAENDRATAAALVTQLAPGTPEAARRWQVESAPVPAWSVEEQARALAAQEVAGTPLVVMNAPYDLTLLDRELRRLRGTRLADHLGRTSLCVLDPLVLDKHLDRARGGRRALPDLCAHYGVPPPPPDGDAESAARAALAVVRALGRRYAPRLSCLSAAELHTLQAVWYAAQVRGTAPWFASRRTDRQVDPAWPLRPESPPAVA